VFNATFNNISV